MSRAHDIHDGIQMGGLALGAAFHSGVQAHRNQRRVAIAQAASDQGAVDAVARLGQALRASRGREAALAAELAAVRVELAAAQGALIRLAR